MILPALLYVTDTMKVAVFRFLRYVSFFNYGYEALVINELKDRTLTDFPVSPFSTKNPLKKYPTLLFLFIFLCCLGFGGGLTFLSVSSYLSTHLPPRSMMVAPC